MNNGYAEGELPSQRPKNPAFLPLSRRSQRLAQRPLAAALEVISVSKTASVVIGRTTNLENASA
jgi:hypothetical protein